MMRINYRSAIGGAFLLAAGVMTSHAREWTSVKGAKVDAEFVGVSGSSVQLKKPDGRVVLIKLEYLCEEDRAFVATQTPPAVPPTANAGRPADIRDSLALTADQVAALKKEATGEKQHHYRLISTRDYDTRNPAKLENWKKGDPIPIRVTVTVMDSYVKNGRPVSERMKGTARLYLTDAETRKTVLADARDLDSMCPT